MVFRPLLCTLFRLNRDQADAGDNEAKLITKLAPECVRTSDPVIRSPARYRWTTAPAAAPSEPKYIYIYYIHRNIYVYYGKTYIINMYNSASLHG